jgi:hypothetical protein
LIDAAAMPAAKASLAEHVRSLEEYEQPREQVMAQSRSHLSSLQAGRENIQLECRTAQAKSAEPAFIPAPAALSSAQKVPSGRFHPNPASLAAIAARQSMAIGSLKKSSLPSPSQRKTRY